MPAAPRAPWVPHISGHVPGVMGVEGTLGTADLAGTARLLPIGVNPQGAMYVDTLLTSGTNSVSVANGTINRVHDVGTLGSLAAIGILHNAGTVQSGSLANLATLHNGTVVIASGTITSVQAATTYPQIYNGATFESMTGGGTSGLNVTVTRLQSGTLGVLSNLTNGSVNILTGTINRLHDVGTLGSIGAIGQIHNGGTVQQDSKPVRIGTPFHTRGTTGAAVWGTVIAASGAGTYQYVSNVDIVVVSGTVDVAVTSIGIDGTTGAGVLTRGQFVPSGGIAKNFDPVHRSGTNGTLAFWLGGAGTVDINVNYWQAT